MGGPLGMRLSLSLARLSRTHLLRRHHLVLLRQVDEARVVDVLHEEDLELPPKVPPERVVEEELGADDVADGATVLL